MGAGLPLNGLLELAEEGGTLTSPHHLSLVRTAPGSRPLGKEANKICTRADT